MHVHTHRRIDVGVELVVQALLKLPLVRYIEHVFTHTGLAVSRLAHDVDHAPGQCTHDLLVVFQQSTVRFTMGGLTDREVGHDNEWELLVRIRVLFHTDESVTYPCCDNRLNQTRTINITKSPILIHNKLFARFVSKVEVFGAGICAVVWLTKDRVRFKIDILQVVIFTVTLQFR